MLKFFFYNFLEGNQTDLIIDSIQKMIDGTKQYERMEDIMLFVMVPDESLADVSAAFDRTYVKIASPDIFLTDQSKLQSAGGRRSLAAYKAVGTDLVTTGLADARFQRIETVETAAEKLEAGLNAGLKVLFCVGEDEASFKDGTSFEVVKKQLAEGVKRIPLDSFYRCAVLYKPLWAFGPEGRSSDKDYNAKMFDLIRKTAEQTRPEFPEPLPLIYGGILEADEAKDLLCREILDGVLIESDRMDTDAFVAFINSCY